MTDTVANPFATGGIAGVKESQEAAAANRTGLGYEYVASLFTKDTDTILVRFIIDEPQWLRTRQHDFAETKPPPSDKPADRKWPENLTAICRRTLGPDKEPIHQDCYICDNGKIDKKYNKVRKASYKMWAIAVVREQVIGTQEMADAGKIKPYHVGAMVGAKDAVIEVPEMVKNTTTGKMEPTGRKIMKKHFVLVNMSNFNFFDGLVACAKAFRTMLDRDYLITKTGEGKDTEYKPVPVAEITWKNPQTDQEEPYDLRNPAVAALYADDKYNYPELVKFVAEKMSDEFYARFFDERVTVPYKSEDVESDLASSAVPEPVTSVKSTDLAAMRDHLLTRSAGAPAAVPAANVAGEAPSSVEQPDSAPMANFPA